MERVGGLQGKDDVIHCVVRQILTSSLLLFVYCIPEKLQKARQKGGSDVEDMSGSDSDEDRRPKKKVKPSMNNNARRNK